MARPKNDINFQSVCVLPNEFTQRFEYNVDGTILYAGHAIKGAAEGDDKWTVQSFAYSSQQVIEIKIAHGSWTSRSGLLYE